MPIEGFFCARLCAFLVLWRGALLGSRCGFVPVRRYRGLVYLCLCPRLAMFTHGFAKVAVLKGVLVLWRGRV